MERRNDPRTPFEIWFEALHKFCSGHELTPDEWDTEESVVFRQLAQYQRDAYKNLVGLMLIEHFVRKEKMNVVLFAPEAARQDVWEPVIRSLPDTAPSTEPRSPRCAKRSKRKSLPPSSAPCKRRC